MLAEDGVASIESHHVSNPSKMRLKLSAIAA